MSKEDMRDLISTSKGIVLGLLFVLATSYVYASWVGPTQSPPSGNVEAPINVSDTYQEKAGDFWAESVGTDDGFCIGADCISAWSSAGGDSIPSGAVMPFELGACPSGWSAYGAAAGRFIVGVGTGDGETYALSDTGGEAFHTLTVDELPSHTHGLRSKSNSAGTQGADVVRSQNSNKIEQSLPTGGDEPHENRPPYVALRYCKKD